MTIAKNILDQLGNGRLIAMTGAKNLCDTGSGLSFRIGRNSKSVNYVKITLNGSDLYDCEFGRIHGHNYKVKSSDQNVHVENLHQVFEKSTGMYLTF